MATEEADPGGMGRLGEQLLGLLPQAAKSSSWRSSGNALRQLFKLGTAETPGQLFVIAVLAALCGTGVVYLLNAEAREIEGHNYSTLYAVAFALLLITYRVSQRFLIVRASAAIEAALDERRRSAVEQLMAVSFRDLDAIDAQRLRDGLSAHYGALSQTIVPLVSGFESLILLVCMFLYLCTISFFAGAIVFLVTFLTVIGYLQRSRQMDDSMGRSAECEQRYRQLSDAIVSGAKELQMNTRRRLALKDELKASSKALAKGRSASAAHFAEMIATGTTISYLLAGAVVFVMPILSSADTEEMSRIVVAVIFLLGPIGGVVQMAQQLATARFAFSSIVDFESELTDLAPERAVSSDTAATDQAFGSLDLVDVEYTHAGGHGFAISNVNLVLSPGDIVFLTGGNGSGKTTLLRVLTGLYPRSGGQILWNGEAAPALLSQEYRNFFSCVFADFYLFDRPYGLAAEQMTLFEHWLRVLRVREKLGDDLNQIDGDKLSTGQRKRVALALALAEERPILVLDEWAADQDPETRRWFYTEFLPQMKSEGRAVFAITHDEAYFTECDRRVHMVEGRLEEIS